MHKPLMKPRRSRSRVIGIAVAAVAMGAVLTAATTSGEPASVTAAGQAVRPVDVDMEPATLTADSDAVEDTISSRTAFDARQSVEAAARQAEAERAAEEAAAEEAAAQAAAEEAAAQAAAEEAAAAEQAPAQEASTGSHWDRLADCESGDWGANGVPISGSARWNYGINFSHGDIYEGGLNFHPGTWDSYRSGDMPGHAGQASRSQQIAVAEQVLADQGWGAWPVCSSKIGLR